MVRPGGVIVHVGLLPGHEGLDIRKLTLQEITLTGTYCYTLIGFVQTVEALAKGWLWRLGWFEQQALSDNLEAFRDIDNGKTRMPKLILRC